MLSCKSAQCVHQYTSRCSQSLQFLSHFLLFHCLLHQLDTLLRLQQVLAFVLGLQASLHHHCLLLQPESTLNNIVLVIGCNAGCDEREVEKACKPAWQTTESETCDPFFWRAVSQPRRRPSLHLATGMNAHRLGNGARSVDLNGGRWLGS